MIIRVITLILFFFFFGFISHAQSDVKITLKLEDASLAKALKELHAKYDLSFAFDSYELSRISGSWNFQNQPLSLVLETLLQPFDLEYKLTGSTYIIFPAEKTEVVRSLKVELNEVFQGEVRDVNSGELLPFAVLVWQIEGKSFNTNADGKFIYQGAINPMDSLLVFFVGYEALTIPAEDLDASGHTKIFLSPLKYYLSTVTVTARQTSGITTDVSTPAFIINPGEFLSRYGLGEPDIFRTAQLLPGVSATIESNNGLFLRGSNSDQTMITLDGFTIYHMDHLFGTFSAINANAVKAMKLSASALDARLGGRAAGVLEVIGKEGDNKKSALKIDLGTISIGAAFESPLDSAGKATLFMCARRSITDGIYSSPYQKLFNTIYDGAIVSDNSQTNTFEGAVGPDFYFQDANVKLTWRPSFRDAINVSLYASRDQLFVQYADTFANETVNAIDVFYNDESTKRNQGASFRWIHDVDQRWQSTFLLAASKFDGQSFSSDSIYEPLFDLSTGQFSSEQRNLGDIIGRLELTGSYRRNKIVTGVVANRMLTEEKLNIDGVINDLEKNIAVVTTFFAEDTWSIIPGVQLVGGIRSNYFDADKRLYFEPRLRLAWQMSDQYNLHLGFGRNAQFIQRVQIQNLYLNRPDIWEIGIKGESNVLTSDQLNAGVTMKLNGLTVQAECYKKWNQGVAFSPGPLADPVVAGTKLPQVLNGTGTSAGLDILVDYFKGRHHAIIGYSLLKAVSSWSEISADPISEFFEQRHELKTAYEFRSASWFCSISWVYGSGRPYTRYVGDLTYELPNGQIRKLPYFSDINSSRLPSYHRLDVAVAKQWMIRGTEMTVSAAVYNLYNRENVRDYQYRTIRTSMNHNDYVAGVKPINMIGFLPTINLSFRL